MSYGNLKWGGVVALLMVWGMAQPAEAHLRDDLVNQPYYTTKRGEFEVEFHNDMHLTDADNDESYSSEHQMELEYGLTDHLQLSYYEVYVWDRSNDWRRDAFKIETKYRFAEAGQWPVDLALYVEYENPNGPRKAHSDGLEGKIILSKDIGPWNFISNVIFSKKLAAHNRWEYEYTAGVSYGVTPRTRLGLEIQQGLGDSKEFAFDSTQSLYLVPGIYTSLTPHVRILAGPAFGMTKASDDFQLRSIVEVEF